LSAVESSNMAVSDFFCPRTHEPLTVSADNSFLESPTGDRYPIVEGIPALLLDAGRLQATLEKNEYYRARAAEYDRGNDVMFRMLLSDEQQTRSEMSGLLQISPGQRVLEVGCGTCRDTVHLVNRGVVVYASDLNREMILIGRDRLRTAGVEPSRVRLFLSDAMRLPFPDGFFDSAFHFGGLNLFPDITAAMAEIARVVKPGGRVVVGDEGVGDWLNQTEFAKILKNSNPLFQHRAPIEKIPTNARNVSCRWILNGSFYLIAFEVDTGEPLLDLDVEFPGWRGGSHRTRYFGRLEGVSPELRDEIVKAAASEGVSVVAWLETALRRNLKKES
jgi:ubiquinone/menaquinone biosynthesis C-methylase UbiE